ncbi:MAG: GxxExxY protein [Candidatus Saganbacteria bacterium]|nr:GxxExxY protein [Candidatus Saganbacteria bacterium]
MGKIVYPELSYQIVGILFKVFKSLGAGLQEKYYQKAIKLQFIKEGIAFLEQVRIDLDIEGQNVGRYYLDFVVDHKIVLEIKVKPSFCKADFLQVLRYLGKSGLELGILARFGRDGVEIKRILKGF